MLPAQVSALRKEETKPDGSIVVTTTINEERRLAATVHLVDQSARIVPRGAFRKVATILSIVHCLADPSGVARQPAAALSRAGPLQA